MQTTQHARLTIAHEPPKGSNRFRLDYTTARGKAATAAPGDAQLAPELQRAPPGTYAVLLELDPHGAPRNIRLAAASPQPLPQPRPATRPATPPPAPPHPRDASSLRVDTIICIHTQQQVANLLPWLELGADRGWGLETPYAAKEGWAGNLQRALGAHVQAASLTIPADEETLPGKLRRRVLSLLQQGPAKGRVAFAWGGGQKPLSAGLWEAFVAWHSREPDAGHIAVYAEPHRGKLLVWTTPEHMEERPLGATPTFQQLAHAAGFEVRPTTSPGPDDLTAMRRLEEVFTASQELRRYAFERAAFLSQEGTTALSRAEEQEFIEQRFKNVLPAAEASRIAADELTRALGGAPITLDPARLDWLAQRFIPQLRNAWLQVLQRGLAEEDIGLPTDPDALDLLQDVNPDGLEARPLALGLPGVTRLGPLFERILESRLRRWLHSRGAPVRELLFNVILQRPGAGQQTAELDVVLVTHSGRLLVIDAKTFKEDSATRNAQTRAVEQLGGSFAMRFIVIPAFQADLPYAGDWYPAPLLHLLNASAPPDAPRTDAARLVPFDETQTLEETLDRLCATPPAA